MMKVTIIALLFGLTSAFETEQDVEDKLVQIVNKNRLIS